MGTKDDTVTDFNIDKLRNVILQFNIPMAFDVLNCMKPADNGKPYIVVIDNIPAKYTLRESMSTDVGVRAFS